MERDYRRRETVSAFNSAMSLASVVESLTAVPIKRRGSFEEVSPAQYKPPPPPKLEEKGKSKSTLKHSLIKKYKDERYKDPKALKASLVEKGDMSIEKLGYFKSSLLCCSEDTLKTLLYDGAVIKFLLRTTNSLNANKSQANFEKVLMCFECFHIIAAFSVGVSFLVIPGVLKQFYEAFLLCIPEVVDQVSQIFVTICKSEFRGSLGDLFREVSKTSNEAFLQPFATVIKSLSTNNSCSDKQLATVIGLLSCFLEKNSIEDRIVWESELMNELGLLQTLTELKKRNTFSLLNAIEKFQDMIISDYQSSVSSDYALNNNNNEDYIQESNEIPSGPDYFSFSVLFLLERGFKYFAYTPETLITDIMSSVFQYQETYYTSNFPETSFGIFIDNAANNFESTDTIDNGFWLDPNATCGDYSFYGQIHAQFKLKPWNLLINIPSDDELLAADLEADPHSTITEVISTVVSAFSFDQSKEYQLFYHQQEIFLDPTLQLLNYTIEENSTFTLSMKRPPLNITFKEKNFSLNFDYKLSILHLQNEICVKMGIPEEQRENYGIFIESSLIEPPEEPTPDHNLLEESTIIESLYQEYSDTFSLHFSRKPDWLYVYVVYPPPDPPHQIDIRVFLDRPVNDGLVIVCKYLQIEPDAHQLFIQTEDGNNIPLSSEKTFIQQRIQPGYQLIIAGKIEAQDDVDVSIWDEEENEYTIKTKESGDEVTVLCGTINQLVRQLTNESKYNSGFINTFLSTYRSFATPTQLLEKLLQRYYVPDWVSQEDKKVIQLRVCVVLKLWVEKFNEDSEKSLFDELNSFIEREKNSIAAVKGIQSAISKKKEQETKYFFTELPPLPRAPKAQSMNELVLLEIDPLEIARQLTKIEFEIFSKIMPVELFGQAWSNPKKQHLCPNLLELINHFNYVSRWIGSCIVAEKKIKQRSRVYNHFILIAENLRNISSFNLLTAVISGINCSSVGRLSYTKSRIPKRSLQALENLEKLTNMENSYKNYRTAISSVQPPLIPYLGVYLQDLTFIEDGNPDYVDGLINFAKRSLVYKILKQIEVFQLEAYNLVTVPLLRAYLMNLPQLSDKDMYAQSLIIEPRNAKKTDIE